MKAIQIMAPKTVKIVDVPVPPVADNEVLVKVAFCVTCPHWDITLFKGVDIFERPGYPHYPIPWGYPGHEMSGDVVKAGSAVKGLKVGDRVAALCTAGETAPGFYCEYINRPEDKVARIPDEVSYVGAASMEMARFMVPYIRRLGCIVGKRTGVTGVGPAGLIALQMLKALGAADVVAVDVNPARLELAMQLGATDTVNSATDEINRLKERPLQLTVDCSGIAAGLQVALDHTRGTLSIFGVPHENVTYTTRHWITNILGAGEGPTVEDTDFVLSLWRRKMLDTETLVMVKLPFERYVEGIEMLMAKKAVKIGFYPA
ncbi:MAG: zinc-binding dehydrogenase [Verrucomicrobia bacterium]|nr:zinc-binding dehydrogenase [Verrucomicrobiota bacterium]